VREHVARQRSAEGQIIEGQGECALYLLRREGGAGTQTLA
jgi:hypothetical protein